MCAKRKDNQQLSQLGESTPQRGEGWEYIAARRQQQSVREALVDMNQYLERVFAATAKRPRSSEASPGETSPGSSDALGANSAAEDPNYVDPLLFAEGIYADQADYEQTIDALAVRINRGILPPRGREAKEEGSGQVVAVIPAHTGLQEIVDKLIPEQREIINLLYFGGFTQREVADKLTLPLGTVKSRAHGALRVLGKLIQK